MKPSDSFSTASVKLSDSDERFLESVDAKFQLVRDHVAGVAMGLHTGMYVYGPGGCGKSFAVIDELRQKEVPYKLYNSRMTGRGLFNALQKSPDAIHVLEDNEQLFKDTGARGVLRSALWSQQAERSVTWSTHLKEHEFIFTGGIIMTANRPFPDIPELDAVKTRISYTQLTLSDQEMIAMMRRLCLDGQSTKLGHVSPVECREVCDYIVDQCGGLNRRFDLRLFLNSVSDYAQWDDVESGCHWTDLVSARIKERPVKIGQIKNVTDRQQEKQRELELVRDLEKIDDSRERRRQWCEGTGKSEKTYYRRRDQLRSMDSQILRSNDNEN